MQKGLYGQVKNVTVYLVRAWFVLLIYFTVSCAVWLFTAALLFFPNQDLSHLSSQCVKMAIAVGVFSSSIGLVLHIVGILRVGKPLTPQFLDTKQDRTVTLFLNQREALEKCRDVLDHMRGFKIKTLDYDSGELIAERRYLKWRHDDLYIRAMTIAPNVTRVSIVIEPHPRVPIDSARNIQAIEKLTMMLVESPGVRPSQLTNERSATDERDGDGQA